MIDEEIQHHHGDIDSLLQGEEDKVEEEFQKLKNISRPSSVDSLIGNIPFHADTF